MSPDVPSEAPTQPAQTQADPTGQVMLPEVREVGGYVLAGVIGRGGMGEVVLARDQRVGRDVALKRMLVDQPEATARFLREATIQARLEHPAIVPVHDLGTDAAGRPYFTMKRVVGRTMFELLRDRPAPQRLLRALVDVCLAVELAHSRGVVHRDLKPSNVMLGDFGEVYVLDWGVARVVDATDAAIAPSPSVADDATQAGALIGTPGYMAPEQARGETVGPAADVYALGAILFEILAGEPLHARADAVVSTLTTPTVSPRARRPDLTIAPELDVACTAALAEQPAARPAARELADRIQQYLDGDRDLERRRALAADELAAARALVAAGDPARRGDAMHAAGRALALDPSSRDAAAIVSQLLLEPPAQPPPALLKRLRQNELALAVRQRKAAAWGGCAYYVFLGFLLWMGVKDYRLFGILAGLVTIMVVGSFVGARRRSTVVWITMLAHVMTMLVISRFMGPFVLVPGLASVVSVGMFAFPTLIDRAGRVLFATVACLLVPFVLEATGLVFRTWQIKDDRFIVHSPIVHLDTPAAVVCLVVIHTLLIIIIGLFVRMFVRSRRDATLQLESQAWHLEQLLPQHQP